MTKRLRIGLWLGAVGLTAVVVICLGFAILPGRDTGRIYRIGWEEVPPFQVKSENGTPTGFAVELVREAARRRGIRLEWVHTSGSETSLRGGHVDLWPLITLTDARKQFIHISNPYVEHEHYLIVRAGSPYWKLQDLAGGTLAYHAMPIILRLIESRVLAKVKLMALPSVKQSIEAVCLGDADAAFVDEFAGSAAMLSGLGCVGNPVRMIWLPAVRTQLGVGATFESRKIADEIRSEIVAIAKDGELTPIMSRWGYYLPQHLESMSKLLQADQLKWRLIYIIGVTVTLLLAVILAALHIRKQKNRLERETAEREHAEKEALEWAGRFRDMLEGVQMVAILVDLDNGVSFCNDYALTLGGWTREEVIGRPAKYLLAPEYIHKLAEATKVSAAAGRPLLASEGALLTKSGQQRWIQWNSTILHDAGGRAVGFACLGEDVTELKRLRAEAANRETEERFRAIFQQAAIGFAQTDLAGNVTLANDRYGSIVGVSSEELIGGNFRSFTHAGDLDSQLAQMDRLLAGEIASFSIETRYVRRDGSVVWTRKNGSLIRDQDNRPKQFIFVVEDISERHLAEAALRESEERFRNMANTTPMLIWVAGTDAKCTFFNTGWLAFTGRTLEQEIGDGWANGVHPDDMARCLGTYRVAFDARRNFQMEYRLRNGNGEYRWLRDYGVPLFGPDGVFAGYIGSCVDVTDLKHAHEADVARQKLETVGVLARGIAHDFNNLLGSILAETELASAELATQPRAVERIEKVRLVAVRAAEIVRELMTYTGQASALFENVDVSALIAEMLHFYTSSISKGATLKTDLPADLPAVRANAAQLRQVILNLIVNASDALGDNVGVITLRIARVQLDPSSAALTEAKLPAGDYIRLEVRDTGCGMTQEVRAKIFDPFFTTKAMGRGIGLATVQGIVRSHGGSIQVTSAPGQGTCFEILLPCVHERAPAKPRPEKTRAASGSITRDRGTVLIVEDEESLRQPVTTILRRQGFFIVEAADGLKAIELFRAKESEIDVVLLDMSLPGRSGAEVLEELRRMRPGVKVILTSAYGEATVMAGIRGSKPWAFIRKPYSPRELGELLASACAKGKAERESLPTAPVR